MGQLLGAPVGVADRYALAAGRHREAALALIRGHGSGHDAAAYLAGYVVECSLKALVEAGGGTGSARPFGHDLEKLRGDGLRLAYGLTRLQRYVMPADCAVDDLVRHWREHLRYREPGAVPPQVARRWVGAAARVCHCLVQKAMLDGVVLR